MCERKGPNIAVWRNRQQLLRLTGYKNPETGEVSLVNRPEPLKNETNEVKGDNPSEVIVYDGLNASVSKIS